MKKFLITKNGLFTLKGTLYIFYKQFILKIFGINHLKISKKNEDKVGIK